MPEAAAAISLDQSVDLELVRENPVKVFGSFPQLTQRFGQREKVAVVRPHAFADPLPPGFGSVRLADQAVFRIAQKNAQILGIGAFGVELLVPLTIVALKISFDGFARLLAVPGRMLLGTHGDSFSADAESFWAAASFSFAMRRLIRSSC